MVYVMSSAREHSVLVNVICLTIGRERDFTLWSNSKVTFYDGKPQAKPGLQVGASDLLGILGPNGRWVALEVKTGNARPSATQRRFLELIRKRGGFACVVRSAEEAVNALNRARRGESE